MGAKKRKGELPEFAACCYCEKIEQYIGQHKELVEILDPTKQKDLSEFSEKDGTPKYVCFRCVVEITCGNRPIFHESYFENL